MANEIINWTKHINLNWKLCIFLLHFNYALYLTSEICNILTYIYNYNYWPINAPRHARIIFLSDMFILYKLRLAK